VKRPVRKRWRGEEVHEEMRLRDKKFFELKGGAILSKLSVGRKFTWAERERKKEVPAGRQGDVPRSPSFYLGEQH